MSPLDKVKASARLTQLERGLSSSSSWARLHRIHLRLHLRSVHLLALGWIGHIVSTRNLGYLSSMARWYWLWLWLSCLHRHRRRSTVANVRLHRIDSVCARMLNLLAVHRLSVVVWDAAADGRNAWELVGRVPVARGSWRLGRGIFLFEHELSRHLHGLRCCHSVNLRQGFLQVYEMLFQHVQQALFGERLWKHVVHT
jgi:hypothetical protein